MINFSAKINNNQKLTSLNLNFTHIDWNLPNPNTNLEIRFSRVLVIFFNCTKTNFSLTGLKYCFFFFFLFLFVYLHRQKFKFNQSFSDQKRCLIIFVTLWIILNLSKAQHFCFYFFRAEAIYHI